ncbi:MAG: tripartite tricarboxylate transporter permease, partial [Thermoplasmatota archaeon]
LVPGIHVNTMALILVAVQPTLSPYLQEVCAACGLPGECAPFLSASVVVSAAVVHSFMDFVPSVFLGAPDESQVLSVLPGHRMLLDGRGLDAVRAAARGSLIGSCTAILLAMPLHWLMGEPFQMYDLLSPYIPWILIGVVVLLLMSEWRKVMVLKVESASPTASTSLIPPRAVKGESARLNGRVRGLPPRLITPQGEWRIRGRAPRGRWVELRGTWITGGRWDGMGWALLLSLLSGGLGYIVMNAQLPLHHLSGLGDSELFPLLTGLFGLPTLLLSLGSGELPPQEELGVQEGSGPAVRGSAAGALVGWFPGITSTAGTVISTLLFREGSGPARFITMVSSVGTSATVFSLVALSVLDRGRTGTMLAVKELIGQGGQAALSSQPSYHFAILLLCVLLSSLLAYHLTMVGGRAFLRLLRRFPLERMTKGIMILVVALVGLFTGLPGLIVLVPSTLLGLVPPRVGVSRVHLTGCLILPLVVYFLV